DVDVGRGGLDAATRQRRVEGDAEQRRQPDLGAGGKAVGDRGHPLEHTGRQQAVERRRRRYLKAGGRFAERLGGAVRHDQHNHHSMPFWPRWPSSKGCLTFVTSLTRSAISTSSAGASRPVMRTCWCPGRFASTSTTSAVSTQPNFIG